MSKKCINCGASVSPKDNNCGYCGTPQYISLAAETSLFNEKIRNSISNNLNDKKKLSLEEELSLIIVYILDDLDNEAEEMLNKLLIKNPKSGRLIFIKSIVDLKLSGLHSASPSEIKNVTSKLNLALSFDDQLAPEIKSILLCIEKDYYNYNSVSIPEKFNSLLKNLKNIEIPDNCLSKEIFKED